MHIGERFRFNAKGACCGTKFSVLATYQHEPARKAQEKKTADFWRADSGAEFEPAIDGSNRLVYVCGCGQSRYARPVIGKFAPHKACSAKCQASTGFQCECSCGGKNHGASHGG